MRVAIVGGNSRVKRQTWSTPDGVEVQCYEGHEAGRLVHAIKAGSVDHVVGLVRWMTHAEEKRILKASPKKYHRWERGIGSLADELPKLLGLAPAGDDPQGGPPPTAPAPSIRRIHIPAQQQQHGPTPGVTDEQVLAVLAKLGRPLSTTDINHHYGFRRNGPGWFSVFKAVKRLCDAGRIRIYKKGGGRTPTLYALATTDNAPEPQAPEPARAAQAPEPSRAAQPRLLSYRVGNEDRYEVWDSETVVERIEELSKEDAPPHEIQVWKPVRTRVQVRYEIEVGEE